MQKSYDFVSVKCNNEPFPNNYWSLYKLGLDGSFINVVAHNPLSVALAVFSVLTSVVTLFATNLLTTALATSVVPIWHILLLIVVLMSHDVNTLLTVLFKKQIQECKNKLFLKIMTAISNCVKNAPMEIHRKYNASDLYEAIQRIVWIYERTTQMIITTAISVIRSVIISIFVMWNNIVLFPIIAISYFIALYFIIPLLYADETKKDDAKHLWERAYTALNNDRNQVLNPNVIPTCSNISAVRKFLEIFSYYGTRDTKWDKSQYMLSLFQNVTVFLIIVALWCKGSYAMILIVLMNRDSFFSVVTAYSDMINTGKRSEKSSEKIFAIINAINDAHKKYATKFCPNKNNEMHSLHFHDLQLDLIPENNTDECNNKTRTIRLHEGHIDFGKLQFILLSASSGSGKSALISLLAGRYSNSCCSQSMVTYTDGTCEHKEFADLVHYRHEVRQLAAEEWKFYGKLKGTLRDFIPFTEIGINAVRDMLIERLHINANVVPISMDDQISTTLSPGEIQRFVAAIELLRAKTSKQDYLILDEVDKDLDPETGICIMKWIIANFNCPIFLVSHSPDVKKFLFNKHLINSVWTYHENPLNSLVTDINIQQPTSDLIACSYDDCD